MLLVEADGAGIVLVDQQIEPLRGQAFRLVEQRQRRARTPMLGRDHDLVEVFRFRIDGDEADQRAVDLGQHDMGDRDQLLAPALAPPRHARIEIDMRKVMRPGAPPQLDRRLFIGGGVGAQGDVVGHVSRAG